MIYDFKYYEAGVENGISGYQNYRWIPEVSFPMAHNLIISNHLTPTSRVLDYGCAKGFLLKAFKLLGIRDVSGVEVSRYAINHADPDVKEQICLIEPGKPLENYFQSKFDIAIFKDVLEHIAAPEIGPLLESTRKVSRRMFVAVPLGIDDTSERFVIPAMHNDITHINIKSKQYWEEVVRSSGWEIESSQFTYPGMKTNWSERFPEGNLFITAQAGS